MLLLFAIKDFIVWLFSLLYSPQPTISQVASLELEIAKVQAVIAQMTAQVSKDFDPQRHRTGVS